MNTYANVFEWMGVPVSVNGSKEARADECPYCERDKFYVNIETGMFHCKHCSAEGNIRKFLTDRHATLFAQTTDAEFRALREKRGGISLQTLKRHELAYDRARKRWLIPFKDAKRQVCSEQEYRLNGEPKRNIPFLKTSLYGLDRLSSDAKKIVYLCEGPFDAIALDFHLGLKRSKYDILATPGPFKEAWAEHFKNRKVRALFDNDDAGRKHAEGVRKSLGDSRIAKDLRLLRWPDEFEDKYDINDLVRDKGREVSIVGWLDKNCVKVTAERKLIVFHGKRKMEEDRKIDWPWLNHLRCGTYVSFSGEMGTLKSTVMLDLIARYTKGVPMPLENTVSMPAGHVLYVFAEDDRSEVEDSFEFAGGDFDKWHAMPATASDGEFLNILANLNEIEETVKEFGIRLMVVDGQNSVVGDPNISTDMKARSNVSNKLHQFAQKMNLALVGIRNEDREGRALGAQSMGDIARCVWRAVEGEADGDNRFLKLIFRKVSDTAKKNYPDIPYGVEDCGGRHRRILWGKSMSEALAKALNKSKNHTRKSIPMTRNPIRK